MGEKVEISAWEYNIVMNEWSACERALEVILKERGVDHAIFGNVCVYLTEGGGVGTAWVNENGEWLRNIDYALANGLTD